MIIRVLLLRFLESYFRHRWLYFVPLVIAFITGLAVVSSSPPMYVASGRLYVEKDSLLATLTASNSSGSWWLTGAQATINEINELLASRAFTRSAIQKTDLERNMSASADEIEETFNYFRSALYFRPQGDKLVEISATSEDPRLAHQMVMAIMDAYVQWKLNSDFQESMAARSFFEAQIQPYKDEVEQARNDVIDFIDANPAPIRGERQPEEQMEIDRLQAALQKAENRLATAQQNEESARLALVKSESVTRQTYMVIDQPQMPTEANVSTRGMLRSIGIFVAVGFILSLVGVALGALLDRSLHFAVDVRYGLKLPVLAMVQPGFGTAQPVTVTETTTANEKTSGEGSTQADPTALQPQI